MRKFCEKLPDILIEFSQSIFGAVWIKKYADGSGHTGIFERWKEKFSVAILNEGNTTAGKVGDKVVREGGGSYQTERQKDSTWVMCILPFPIVSAEPPIEVPEVADNNGVPEFGEHSDRVASMQRALNKNGFNLKIDGKYGPMTKSALAKFQKSKGLTGTGIAGPKTLELLK